jgi:predicted polyphosphate/ATP-dependent NAD kinase
MPDTFGIGVQAIHDLHRRQPEVVSGVNLLDIEITGSPFDSTRSARLLHEIGASCIITLGGDGTIRVAAKGCGDTPLLPVSTGTNNVLPQFIEGTIAGIAAGLFAKQSSFPLHDLCYRSKRFDILVNGIVVDIALVDVGLVSSQFIGSRAIWDAGTLRQIAVTRASPASIGLSAVVGLVKPVGIQDLFGAMATIGADGRSCEVLAPLGPGLIVPIPIREINILEPDKPYPLLPERPLVLALDGEREITLQPGEQASIILRTDGPWIVDVDRVLKSASQNHWMEIP